MNELERLQAVETRLIGRIAHIRKCAEETRYSTVKEFGSNKYVQKETSHYRQLIREAEDLEELLHG